LDLFCFDGTLADSLQLGVKVANILAQKYKYKQVDIEKINYYRDLTAQELLKEFDISWLKLLVIGPRFKKEFFNILKNLNQ
jgi:phosphoglycolate phosphatase-like HAD superfamily hydrolase